MGYHVITVSDKDSLLKRLAVGSFHAVVVRVDQADAGADTAVQEVRSAHPGVRVIAYAPYAAKSLRDEFEKENIRYFIHPFRANEIRRAMT